MEPGDEGASTTLEVGTLEDEVTDDGAEEVGTLEEAASDVVEELEVGGGGGDSCPPAGGGEGAGEGTTSAVDAGKAVVAVPASSVDANDARVEMRSATEGAGGALPRKSRSQTNNTASPTTTTIPPPATASLRRTLQPRQLVRSRNFIQLRIHLKGFQQTELAAELAAANSGSTGAQGTAAKQMGNPMRTEADPARQRRREMNGCDGRTSQRSTSMSR